MVKSLSQVSRMEKWGLGIRRAGRPPARRNRDELLGPEGNFLESLLLQSQGLDTYQRLHPLVERLLARLNKREAEILRMHYGIEDGFPKTWKEIGSRFQLSPAQACEMAGKALEKLHFVVTCRMHAIGNN